MSFKDLIKNSVFDTMSANTVSGYNVLITLTLTLVLSVYLFFIYKMVTKNVFYSKSFNISMSMISLLTAAIILAMQSSLAISLGMVGALSIVRFRTAIKEPMDLLFLFWSIGNGIICGAGLFKIAIIVSIVVTVGILVLDLLPMKKAPLLLIFSSQDREIEDKVLEILSNYTKKYKIKSRNFTREDLHMIIELRTEKDKELMRELTGLDKLDSVSLLAHDGEVRSA